MTDPSPASPDVEAQPRTLDEARRRIEHLQRALEARGRTGQAVGILMCRYMISADAAFSAMSRVSQCHNLKVRALADAVIATIDQPGKPLPRELLDALEELLRVGEGGNDSRLNGSPPWWAPPSARF
jgi:alkanesulfonate monooxygenase SsuD/methylene tetrahydromethanopterin reductase-like flavin-dependent oxidoreductase (luciferase family)